MGSGSGSAFVIMDMMSDAYVHAWKLAKFSTMHTEMVQRAD